MLGAQFFFWKDASQRVTFLGTAPGLRLSYVSRSSYVGRTVVVVVVVVVVVAVVVVDLKVILRSRYVPCP